MQRYRIKDDITFTPTLTAIVVSSPTTAATPPILPTPSAAPTIARGGVGPGNKFYRDLTLIELTTVCGIPCTYRILDGLELHEGVIALHVDAY